MLDGRFRIPFYMSQGVLHTVTSHDTQEFCLFPELDLYISYSIVACLLPWALIYLIFYRCFSVALGSYLSRILWLLVYCPGLLFISYSMVTCLLPWALIYLTFNSCFCLLPWALTSSECEQLIRRMLVTNPAKRQSLSKVLTHKWMVAEGKGGAGGGEGEPKKELECRLQVYDETTGAVHWCEPVLSVIQQMGLDVNEVKRVS